MSDENSIQSNNQSYMMLGNKILSIIPSNHEQLCNGVKFVSSCLILQPKLSLLVFQLETIFLKKKHIVLFQYFDMYHNFFKRNLADERKILSNSLYCPQPAEEYKSCPGAICLPFPTVSDSPNTVSDDIRFQPEYSAEINSAILAGFSH